MAELPRIIDGDTYAIGDTSYRVTGLDAPEAGKAGNALLRQRAEPGAAVAAAHLRQALPELRPEGQGTDRYGRELVDLRTAKGESYGTRAIQQGVALPMLHGSREANAALESAFVRNTAMPGARSVWDEAMAQERVVNPYQLNLAALPDRGNYPASLTRRAWDRGLANLRASLGAAGNFLGEKLGVNALADWGEEYMARALVDAALNPAEVATFEDAEGLGEIGTWAYEKVVENIPNMLTMVTGAGAGGLVTAGVGKALLQNAVRRSAAATLGARVGAVGATYPVHLGEGWRELQEAGVDAADTIAPYFTAAINTALDVAPMEGLLRYSFKGLEPALAKDLVRDNLARLRDKGVLASVAEGAAKGGVLGFAVEAPTELAQELVNLSARAYHDPEFDWDDPEIHARLREAALAGGVVGAAMGGAGRGVAQGVGALSSTSAPAPAPTVDEPAAGVDEPSAAPASTVAPEPAPAPSAPASAVASEPAPAVPEPGVPEPGAPEPSAPAASEPVQTVPEPAQDVLAQLDTLTDGAFRYFEVGSLDGLTLPEGLRLRESRHDGGVYVYRKGDRSAAAKVTAVERKKAPASRDAARGKALGYPQSKAEAAANGAPAVVQGTQGDAVVYEAAVDGTDAEAVAAAEAAAEARGAETVVQTTPEAAVARRQALAEAPPDDDGLPAEIDRTQWARVSARERQAVMAKVLRGEALDEDDVYLLNFITNSHDPADIGASSARLSPAASQLVATVAQAAGHEASEVVESQVEVGAAETSAVHLEADEALALEPVVHPMPELSKGVRELAARNMRRVLALLDLGGAVRLEQDQVVAEGLVLPPALLRDPDVNANVVRSLLRAAAIGAGRYDRRQHARRMQSVVVGYVSSEAASSQTGMAAVPLDVRELAEVGAALQGRTYRDLTPVARRDAVLDGIAWLAARGMTFDDTTSFPRPGVTVIFTSGENGIKWGRIVGARRSESEASSTVTYPAGERGGYVAVEQPARWTEGVPADEGARDIPVFERRELPERPVDRRPEAYGEEAIDRSEVDPDDYYTPASSVEDQAVYDSEAAQLRRSLGSGDLDAATPPRYDGSRRRGDSRPPRVAERFRVVGGSTGSYLRRYADGAAAILTEIGVRFTADAAPLFTDAGGLDTLLRAEEDPRNRAELLRLRDERPLARTLFLRVAGTDKVRPVIYISDRFKAAHVRDRAVLHELGHVVLRHALDVLPAAQLQQLRNHLGGDNFQAFEEHFANAFLNWVEGVTQEPGGERARDEIARAVELTLRALQALLRKFWLRFRRRFGTDQTFAEFMEALVNRERYRRGSPRVAMKTEFGRQLDSVLTRLYGPRSRSSGPLSLRFHEGLAMSLDWTPPSALRRAAQQRHLQRWLTAAQRSATAGRTLLAHLWSHSLKPYDAILRQMGLVALANQFRREPGKSRVEGQGFTFDHEERQVLQGFLRDIERVVQGHVTIPGRLGKLNPFYEPQYSAALQEAGRALVEEREPSDPAAREIVAGFRRLFGELYDWARERGVYMGERARYSPVVYSAKKLLAEGAREEFLTQVVAWGQTPEARQWWREQGREQPPTEADMQRLGEHLYQLWTGEQGVYAPLDTAGFDFVAPGFAHRRQRQLPPGLHAALTAYREDNIVQLSQLYVRALVKRGLWQQRFGLNDVLGQLEAERVAAYNLDASDRERLQELAREWGRRHPEAQTARLSVQDLRHLAIELAAERREQVVAEYQEQYGVNIYDPSAGLKLLLQERVAAGALTQSDYDRVVNEILPAYQGMLGAGMHPGWRRLQALLMVYQAARVLSLGVFSQFVDLGTLAARLPSGQRTALVRELARLRDGRSREELRNDAQLLGVWSNDITEHLLNDQAGVMLGSRRVQRFNEWIFRINGMHGMTNYLRAISVSLGKRVVETYVRELDSSDAAVAERARRGLAMLNIPADQARAWVQAGMAVDYDERFADVLNGLHQFVDETIIHPSAAIRPRFGNDQRLALFFHLKGFMYGFHMQVLQRVWNQARERWGEEQGARKVAALMPVLALAAFTLPLAALGMELRWLLAPPRQRPEGGFDYFWETLQRTGMPGLAQMLADIQTSEDYGKLGVLALGGPTVSQFEDFLSSDLGTALERSLPAYPLVRALRDRLE